MNPNNPVEGVDRRSQLHNFEFLQKIGKGAYSSVWKVRRNNDSELYALKMIKLRELKKKEIDNTLNEVRLLASIKSPFILGYRDAFYDPRSKNFCIVTEYAEGGDLNKLLDE
jgi:NIMA (never in mitosis gene a)-related kinase